MHSQTVYGVLERKIDLTIERLDQMLLQINGYQPLLEHNAHCAESEIKASFDGLIEALTQRRSLLIRQLHKVCEDKMSLIANQKQAIESLRAGIISCIPNRYSTDSSIHDFLARAESAVFSSSSAPFVSFRSERSILPQAIANYGRVISRYCGHFADPGQPSSCLPLAFEDEDDHDFSPNHTGTCECDDSGVRLFSKSCLHQNKSHGKPCGEKCEDKSIIPSLTCKASRGSLPPLSMGMSCHGCERKPCITGDTCATRSTVYTEPCALFLRNWLGSEEPVKVRNSTRSLLGFSGKSSNSFGSDRSENTCDAESGSFTVLTDSNAPQSASLKDWLFFDPMELQNMPGLSKKFSFNSKSDVFEKSSMRNANSKFSEDLSLWLVPSSLSDVPKATSESSDSHSKSNMALYDSTRDTSVLPSYLTETGPVDLNRWLYRDPSVAASPAAIEDLEDSPEANPAEQTEVVLAEGSVTDSTTPEYCIYSQCLGGPGGPTCCGARISCDQLKRTINESSVTSSTIVAVESESTNLSNDSESVAISTARPVVVQLRKIADTHLSQWLKSDCVAEDTNCQSSLVAKDRSSFLPDADCAETLGDVDASVTPPKRRNIGDKIDVTHADCCKLSTCCACETRKSPLSGMQRPCDRANCTPVSVSQIPAADPDEVWLSEKLSALSANDTLTRHQALDQWLISSPVSHRC